MSRFAVRAVLGLALLAGCAGPRPSPEVPPPPPRETAPDLRALQDEARALLLKGDFAGAERRLDAADAMVPGHPETRYLRGLLLESQEDPEAALPHLRAAWHDDPDRKERRVACWRVLVAVAENRYHADAFTQAWDLLEEAGRVDPEADLAYLQGTVAYALAQSLYSPEESPEDLRAVERRRWLAQAETAFREAIERDGDDVDARFNLAAVLVAADRGPEAVEMYRSLLGHDPEDAELYLAMAHAYEISGNPAQGAVCRTVSHAITAGREVEDVKTWAERRVAAAPGSALAETLGERGLPESIRVGSQDRATVEVWIYRKDRLIEVFQQGSRQGIVTWR